MDAHKNFAQSTLASPPSSTDGTELTVATGHGTRFPAAPFNATLWPAGVAPTVSNAEIVRVTGKATDVFTIVRAQEGSSARTHAANDQIAATVTSRVLTDAEYGAHGIVNAQDPVYGAVGDGATDDSVALQAAIDAAAGGTLILPAGDYLLGTGLTFTADYSTIIAHGARLLVTTNIIPLTVGTASTAPQLYPQILGNLRAYKSGSIATTVGFRLRAVYNGRFEISAQRFDSNIEVRPPSTLGFAYNQVYMQDMTGCGHSGLRLNTGDGGFVNENDFYNGRFDNANATCTALIYAPDTGTAYGNPNNNRFHNPNLELSGTGTVDALYVDGGYHNAIIHPRPEVDGTATINQAPFWITSDALLAFVDDRYIGSRSGTIKNEGVNTRFLTNSQRFVHYRDAFGAAEQGERIFRTVANSNDLPLGEWYDLYQGSGNNQGHRIVLNRNTAGGYYVSFCRVLSMVSNGGRLYECITDHTSGSSSEPGVGGSWATYWKLLPTGSDVGGASAWVTSTGYSATVEVFRVGPDGTAKAASTVLTAAAASAATGQVALGNATQSTVGAAGGASALPATPTGYLKMYIGSSQYVIPYYAQA